MADGRVQRIACTHALAAAAAARPAYTCAAARSRRPPPPSLHCSCLQYDKARNFTNLINLMHNDQAPALVVYAASEDDVSAAVRFAAQRALPLCVRSGGHDSTGASICDKGVVVDVSQINWVRRKRGVLNWSCCLKWSCCWLLLLLLLPLLEARGQSQRVAALLARQ